MNFSIPSVETRRIRIFWTMFCTGLKTFSWKVKKMQKRFFDFFDSIGWNQKNTHVLENVFYSFKNIFWKTEENEIPANLFSPRLRSLFVLLFPPPYLWNRAVSDSSSLIHLHSKYTYNSTIGKNVFAFQPGRGISSFWLYSSLLRLSFPR